MLRNHRIRLVQVARAGRYEEDGIEVLDDSIHPETLCIDAAYKLSDELLFASGPVLDLYTKHDTSIESVNAQLSATIP